MPVYLDPATGVLRRHATPLGAPWREVEGSGTLFRTRLRNGEWVAERGHCRRSDEYERSGWERVVSWKSLAMPSSWQLGSRSGIRFGFAEEPPREGIPRIAVVLPGEPSLASTACCPGSRYVMQLGMLTEGVPPDYLVEKLLTARLRQVGLSLQDFVWNLRVQGQPGCREATDAERRRLAELRMLADGLSDDLQEAARAAFGEGHASSAWSRQRQVKSLIRRAAPSSN